MEHKEAALSCLCRLEQQTQTHQPLSFSMGRVLNKGMYSGMKAPHLQSELAEVYQLIQDQP